jgi:tripartite ATP-independent transporter DctP family solute receptor
MCKKSYISIVILTIGLLFLGSQAWAAKVKIKVAHVDKPDRFESCMGAMSNTFKDLVESMSGGEIEVEIFPAGQLGNMREMVESTQMGATQIVICYTSVGTIFSPELMVVQIPFIFPTAAHAWRALDGQWGKDLADELLRDAGLRNLAWGEGFGFRVVWNNKRPIRRPADLKGLKIRVPESKGLFALFKALGAAPVTITWTELYTALQTGAADGCEPELGGGAMIKLYETTKYVTLTNHAYNIHGMWANEKWFQSLSNKHKKIIIEAARVAEIASRGISQNIAGASVGLCISKGMEIYSPTTEEMGEFIKQGQSAYLKAIEKDVGKEWIDKTLKAAKQATDELDAEAAKIVK